MPKNSTTIRPTTPEAIAQARSLIGNARIGALAVLDPETSIPAISRIGLACANGVPLSLMSDLSAHTKALYANPKCSLLVGEPDSKGDPLTHPRLSITAKAEFVSRDHPDHSVLHSAYLAQNPKAKLYIDFADFNLVLLHPTKAALNGGFGKAFDLTAQELLSD